MTSERTAAAAPPGPRSSRARRLSRIGLRLVLLVAVPAVALAVGLYFYAKGGRHIETENAYVKADVVAVSADLDGRVVWVGVGNNQLVSQGQVLFRLDPAPLETAVAQADARLDVVRTEVESLQADHRQAQVEAAEARDRVAFLERQYQRQRRIREKGLGTEELYDKASHELAMARRRVRILEERTARVLASLGGDAAAPVDVHPRFRQALAERAQALINLGHALIKAPTEGIVSNVKLQAGEWVEEGRPVFSLIATAPAWVEANLKETQLTYVRVGQTAMVTVDAYPGLSWPGRVAAIAPATGAEFALLPPQNATGNWVKVVQRVPVIVELDEVAQGPDGAEAPRLRAGMTVTATIDTKHRRELPAGVRRLLQARGLHWLLPSVAENGAGPDALRGVLRQATAAEG